MAKQRVDVFPNRAMQQVVMSAANTITFQQMRFAFGAFTGSALIIHRCDWFPSRTSIVEIVANADALQMAITNRDDLAALLPGNMNILAMEEIHAPTVGSATNFQQVNNPISTDFSNLPGGGLIVPANPLFVGLLTAGFSAAATVDLIMYYTVKQLTDADFIELVQSLIPVNI